MNISDGLGCGYSKQRDGLWRLPSQMGRGLAVRCNGLLVLRNRIWWCKGGLQSALRGCEASCGSVAALAGCGARLCRRCRARLESGWVFTG
uniref:Uncharacterized protein n=1 Tax=Fagus sylvatica TaxID=28930 RepID=A0A2N9FIB7_FAGSY